MDGQLLAILSVGFVLGLRHAMDADHVAAVTTFISRERSLLRTCWIGVFWGLGHTAALLVAGILVLVFRTNIPRWIEARFELAVAVMLIALGIRALIQSWRENIELHQHEHAHGMRAHAHWHVHLSRDHETHTGWTHFGLRPMVVGMVHGAAGSAAVMLLVLSTIPSPVQAVSYIVLFGAGSVLGMIGISLILAVPMSWASHRVASGYRYVQLLAGIFSCLAGLYLGWENLGV